MGDDPMSEPTTCPPSTVSSPLLHDLLVLLAAHRPAFQQERCFSRMTALLFGMLFAFARHTVTQLLLALGLTRADWSAWYRLFSGPRLHYDVLTRCFLRELLDAIPASEVIVTVVDGVQIPRHSKTMPGTAWLKNPRTPPFKPAPWRAQRYTHLAGLTPCEQGYSRALPLRLEPAFPPKAVPAAGWPARTEWEAGRAELGWMRSELDHAGRQEQRLLVLADGAYDVADLWSQLPAHTTLMARTARNRVLYALPPPEQRRGKPRKYGARAPLPAAWLEVSDDRWQEATLLVRGRQIPLVYRIEGPYVRRKAATQPVFLLVVKGVGAGTHRGRRDPAFYLISAIPRPGGWQVPLPAEDLLAWAWQRWEVEVCRRELKSGWGMGEMQCWNPTATVVSVQWQAWVYSVLVLAGYRAWGLTHSPLRPPARWWGGAPRWSLGTLWRGYRQELWSTPDFVALWSRTGDNWPEKHARITALHNAIGSSLRL
jgi:hypothetical protein